MTRQPPATVAATVVATVEFQGHAIRVVETPRIVETPLCGDCGGCGWEDEDGECPCWSCDGRNHRDDRRTYCHYVVLSDLLAAAGHADANTTRMAKLYAPDGTVRVRLPGQ